MERDILHSAKMRFSLREKAFPFPAGSVYWITVKPTPSRTPMAPSSVWR